MIETIRKGCDYLKQSGIENPKNDCELLLMHILKQQRSELYLKNDALGKEESGLFKTALDKRNTRYPLQYITGLAYFMDLELGVGEDVLIPRPETEILVEEAVKRLSGKKNPLIIDVGTGSGNIAISLTKRIPECKIIAIDISGKALRAARNNADRYGCGNINFLRSDLLNNVTKDVLREADAIVSNPPYINQEEYKILPKEVHFEPKTALFGGKDGLDFHRRIISEASESLKKGAFLVFEVGDEQAQKVIAILDNTNLFCGIEAICDYNDIKRVVAARKR